MRKLLVVTLLVLIVHSTAFSDDPPLVPRHAPPPTVGTMVPSAVAQQPAPAASTIQQSGSTEINACKVETITADGAITVLLTDQPKIKHSSKTNGSFSVSAHRMRFSIPSDTIRDPAVFSFSDFDATGSCVFSSDSIRVSANRMVLKSLPNNARSTITFEGDVSVLVGKISGSADSITLTRTDAAWGLSGLLTAPKDGG